jgi:hypothetical protein
MRKTFSLDEHVVADVKHGELKGPVCCAERACLLVKAPAPVCLQLHGALERLADWRLAR